MTRIERMLAHTRRQLANALAFSAEQAADLDMAGEELQHARARILLLEGEAARLRESVAVLETDLAESRRAIHPDASPKPKKRGATAGVPPVAQGAGANSAARNR